MKKLSWLVATVAAAVTGGALAVTVPETVTKESALWLDASTLTQAAGTQLDSWADARGAGRPTATSYKSVKPQVIEIADGELAGKKAVTFFTVGTQCDMQFPRITGIKTVFFVVDMDQSMDAFWLGDSTYSFHRGNNGAYWYNNGNVDVVNTVYHDDGRLVANPTGTVVPTGYRLVTYQRTGSNSGSAQWITCDRGGSTRIGGKRLCEVIVFTRAMNDFERSQIEGYLKYKWFGGDSQAVRSVEMLGKKAQVRFDASAASSFHYDVESDNTLVSQWDDLSGNNNHLKPFQFDANNPKYGKVITLNTMPAYDLGAVGSHIEMQLTTRLTTTRTVVFVGDIARSDIFWLGDKDNFRFHRGMNGQYAYSHSSSWLSTVGKIWRNGERVADMFNEYPDIPGGPSVYVLQIPANCEWMYLSRDRTSAGGARNGGKQICELVTLGSDFTEAECVAMSKMFEEKWTPAMDSILSMATLHVDAAKRDNFNYNGASINGWKNTGSGNDLTAVGFNGGAVVPGTWGYTNGVPAFLMRQVGSGIDMGYTRITDIRSVFWVMDIQRYIGAFFLGDTGAYHFHRGLNGQYSGNYAGMRDGDQYCDGAKVKAPLNEMPPYGMHVFNVALAGNCQSDRISSDRGCSENGIGRNGGRALSELIIFNKSISGLPMIAIQRHLKQKWRETSGWRADDAEWGAQQYRVFAADAEVPAEGAAAEGIGVNADATISGGTLTLGEGGVFAATNVTATVAAPLAAGSPLVAGGFGVVALTTAPAPSAIIVNRGSTLKLPLYGSVTGTVSLHEGAKLVFDVANFTAGQHVALSFSALSLPAGADFNDYVTTSDPEHNTITLSQDGTQLLVNSPTIPLTANWVGNGDWANAYDPANWECRNAAGEVLADALPTTATIVTIEGNSSFNLPVGQTVTCRELRFRELTLTADCDWRGLGVVDLEGAKIDLAGHKLYVTGFTGDGTITDFSAATTMKYFKLVVRKTYFGSDAMMQFSEFCLYAADGTRQNLNLADAGQTAANELAAGSFSAGGAYASSPNEALVRIFDGNTGTKWGPGNNNMANSYDNEAAWRIVNLRLADDAKPIVAYNLYTANDSPNRQPSGWDLYASADGTDWTLVDRRKGLARLGTFFQPISPSFPLANATPGELHLEVAEGKTFTNTSVKLDGNVRLVKEGKGAYVASYANQSYAGDTVVTAGTVKPGMDGSFPFGVSGAKIVLEEGGTYDANGKTGKANANFECNGGTITCSVDGRDGACALGAINLNCDTTISFPLNDGIGNGISDLRGHTLTVNIGTAGKYFYIANEAYDNDANPYNEVCFTNGTLKLASGGWFKVWSKLDCRTVDFDVNCAFSTCWRTDVKDLIWRYGGNAAIGSAPKGFIAVHGKFTPIADRFYRTLMLNGSTLNLADKTGVWSTKSALTANGTNYCTFENNATITVDVHGRKLKDKDQLIAWEAAAKPTGVTFVLDAATAGAGRKLKVEEDGVYYCVSGFMIFVR